MSETTITDTRVMKDPPYEKTAAGLLEACRTFYRNQENEKAFQEWKKEKKQGLTAEDLLTDFQGWLKSRRESESA